MPILLDSRPSSGRARSLSYLIHRDALPPAAARALAAVEADGRVFLRVPCQAESGRGGDKPLDDRLSNLGPFEIFDLARAAYNDRFDDRPPLLAEESTEEPVHKLLLRYLPRTARPEPKEPGLTVAFAGEPMDNVKAVLGAMREIAFWVERILERPWCRFEIETGLPQRRLSDFLAFERSVALDRLSAEVRLALTDDRLLRAPGAGPASESAEMLRRYRRSTGNAVAVLYAPVSGLNDSAGDADRLAEMVGGDDIPVVLLEPEGGGPSVEAFAKRLAKRGVPVERRRALDRDLAWARSAAA